MFASPQLGISAVEIHMCQRQVEVRLALRFVVRPENALRFMFIARFETRLNSAQLVHQIEHTPRTTDQTECLFHCFTHVYECAGIGDCRMSEQWASGTRAETIF
jgi:hypothetical protein